MKQNRADKMNEDLINKINSLEPDIAFLAHELLYYIDHGDLVSKIEENIKNEINEIVKGNLNSGN